MDSLSKAFFENSLPYVSGITDFSEMKKRKINSAPGTVFICRSGNAQIMLNQTEYVFKVNDVMILFPDVVPYIVELSDNFSCRFILMSKEFVDEATARISNLFFDIIFFQPVVTPSEKWLPLFDSIISTFNNLHDIGSEPYRYVIMRNLMETCFMMLDSGLSGTELSDDFKNHGRSQYVFREFWKLMVRFCPEERSVSFYADKLCITPYYLNKCVKKASKTTAKEFIDRQVVINIKELLHSTQMSIDEIASELFFEDPSYMCRFFKKKTGMTLSNFRDIF